MIASPQVLRYYKPVTPFHERSIAEGMTFGLGPAGYDVRCAEAHRVAPGGFVLGSTVERFEMPDTLLGIVHDKSTWARRGLCVQNTVIEPGWRGFLTLELTNHGTETIDIVPGVPIAQVIFHMLACPTDVPYVGRYQDQAAGPQPAKLARP